MSDTSPPDTPSTGTPPSPGAEPLRPTAVRPGAVGRPPAPTAPPSIPPTVVAQGVPAVAPAPPPTRARAAGAVAPVPPPTGGAGAAVAPAPPPTAPNALPSSPGSDGAAGAPAPGSSLVAASSVDTGTDLVAAHDAVSSPGAEVESPAGSHDAIDGAHEATGSVDDGALTGIARWKQVAAVASIVVLAAIATFVITGGIRSRPPSPERIDAGEIGKRRGPTTTISSEPIPIPAVTEPLVTTTTLPAGTDTLPPAPAPGPAPPAPAPAPAPTAAPTTVPPPKTVTVSYTVEGGAFVIQGEALVPLRVGDTLILARASGPYQGELFLQIPDGFLTPVRLGVYTANRAGAGNVSIYAPTGGITAATLGVNVNP